MLFAGTLTNGIRHLITNPANLEIILVNALANPLNMALSILTLGILAAAFNFLLLRHAQVKD
ncbi:MAG: hypothetical protein FWE20_13230 [Defluviitaleaceae bacterium]|nr:hypothetical protein [Defluviitaleaceae bacterium]